MSTRETKDEFTFLEFMMRASLCSIAADLAMAIHHEAFPEGEE